MEFIRNPMEMINYISLEFIQILGNSYFQRLIIPENLSQANLILLSKNFEEFLYLTLGHYP